MQTGTRPVPGVGAGVKSFANRGTNVFRIIYSFVGASSMARGRRHGPVDSLSIYPSSQSAEQLGVRKVSGAFIRS